MQVTEGDFQAKVLQLGFKEINPGQPPLVQIEVALGTKWNIDKWEKLSADSAECPVLVIEKFLYKQNGDISDFNWKNLQEVLGWDGVSLETLANLDVSRKYINVRVEKNEKGYLEGKWLNKVGDTPKGIPKKEIKKMAAQDLGRWTAKGAVQTFPDLNISEDNVPF